MSPLNDSSTGETPVRGPDEPGSTFIQWKGTNVCMDVECLCGEGFHVDAEFCYAARCPHCGKVMVFGSRVAVMEAPQDYDGMVVDVSP